METALTLLCGFLGGVSVISVLILIADNREWVRNLKKKHGIKL